MPHYFTNDPGEKRRYDIVFPFHGLNIRFATSDGVFSKFGVDSGTFYLLDAALPRLLPGRKALADLGCGYGAVGISAALLDPGCTVAMYDVNENAVELANLNARANGVSDRAVAYVRDAASSGIQSADYVMTNPPFRAGKSAVLGFFNRSLDALTLGGSLFVVLRKQQGAESYTREIESIFGNCAVICKKKGYIVAEAVKDNGVFDDQELGK